MKKETYKFILTICACEIVGFFFLSVLFNKQNLNIFQTNPYFSLFQIIIFILIIQAIYQIYFKKNAILIMCKNCRRSYIHIIGDECLCDYCKQEKLIDQKSIKPIRGI